MPAVLIEDIHKSYGRLEVLKGVSLSVDAGQVVAIIGRSGSGKSTLLRCINGLETFQSGKVVVAGHDMTQDPKKLRELRKDVGIVFQSYNLFPHLSVLDNVTLASRVVHRMPRKDAEARALDLLARIGLGDYARAHPDRLSGGQQQRAAIVRAIATDPEVLLLDEITSALDPELVNEVLAVVKQLASEGMTLIMVTHEMRFAREVGDKLAFMHHGKVHEIGDPKALFAAPQTEELSNFIGSVNL